MSGFASSSMQAPSLDASDLMSIGDHLGGKKIDNAIEKARYAGIPQQGEQTGGFSPSYAHLSHIPLFPLYSAAQLDVLAHAQRRKEQKLSYMQPLPSRQDNLVMNAAAHLSGGMNPVSVVKWENRLKGAGVITTQKIMEQSQFLVFTRWAIPGSREIWFVDVLEWRAGSGTAGTQVYVKTGKTASFKTLGSIVKDRKANKLWTKRFMNFDHCEALSFLADDKSEVPMEIVARIQRPIAGMEARESLKSFEKEWIVPLVRSM